MHALWSLLLAVSAYQASAQLAGGWSQLITPTNQNDPVVREITATAVKDAFASMTGEEIKEFVVISYKMQVVAGRNYMAKVRYATDEYAHILVFVPLPYTGNPPELQNAVVGRFPSDPLVILSPAVLAGFDSVRFQGTWYEIYRTSGSPYQTDRAADICHVWENDPVDYFYKEWVPRQRRSNQVFYRDLEFDADQPAIFTVTINDEKITFTVFWTDYDNVLIMFARPVVNGKKTLVIWILSRTASLSDEQTKSAFDRILQNFVVARADFVLIRHGVYDRWIARRQAASTRPRPTVTYYHVPQAGLNSLVIPFGYQQPENNGISSGYQQPENNRISSGYQQPQNSRGNYGIPIGNQQPTNRRRNRWTNPFSFFQRPMAQRGFGYHNIPFFQPINFWQ